MAVRREITEYSGIYFILPRRVTLFGNSARVKALEHKMLTCLHGRSQGDN